MTARKRTPRAAKPAHVVEKKDFLDDIDQIGADLNKALGIVALAHAATANADDAFGLKNFQRALGAAYDHLEAVQKATKRIYERWREPAQAETADKG